MSYSLEIVFRPSVTSMNGQNVWQWQAWLYCDGQRAEQFFLGYSRAFPDQESMNDDMQAYADAIANAKFVKPAGT